MAWDEREDLTDTALSSDSEGQSNGEESLVSSEIQSVKTPVRDRRCKKRAAGSGSNYSGQFTYPLDLWFILSKYILPLEVKTFALICRGANDAVSSTTTFWLRLYHRHVEKVKLLPERLKPNRIDCRPGLRARVVRALFHVYEPLKAQLMTLNAGLSEVCPSSLELQTCTSVWCKATVSQKQKKIWTFYMKFADEWALQHQSPRQFSLDWFDRVDIVNENFELGRCVLQVNCPNFIAIPAVNGLVLTSILVGISRDMRHSSVRMIFHTPRHDGRFRKEDGLSVTLDPASDVRVLHWWHPLYPYASSY